MGKHGKHGPLVGLRGIITAALLSVAATGAQAAPCRLALLLAIDVSSSVNAQEDALQRGGLASALIAPEVQDAFFGRGAPVAIAAFEWSGRYNQRLLLDWSLIETPADLIDAATTIGQTERTSDSYPTAIGHALGHAATLFAMAPDCAEQVIDIAGDGINNEGFGPAQAYAHFPLDGVTVNGLVVEDGTDDAALLAYYRTEVLRGPNAFVERARGFDDYANAMQRKLLRELGVQVLGHCPKMGPRHGPSLPSYKDQQDDVARHLVDTVPWRTCRCANGVSAGACPWVGRVGFG